MRCGKRILSEKASLDRLFPPLFPLLTGNNGKETTRRLRTYKKRMKEKSAGELRFLPGNMFLGSWREIEYK